MKRAFTLIELLVVIAIIAILAAILFPVFAQAKDAAKNTTLLSGVKQMGTSIILYGGDSDDLFPPTMSSHPSLPIDLAWQDLVQPYMKNYDLLVNLKRTRPTGTAADVAWLRLQHFGMPARAVTNDATAATGYFTGTHAGNVVRYDGIAGFGNLDPSQPDWLGRAQAGASSLSSSSVADISTTAMVVEGNNWDLWWSFGAPDPLRSCNGWSPDNISITGANYNYGGPTTSTRATNGANGYNGTTAGCSIPVGRTTYVATDSSAKGLDFRANMYNGVDSQNGATNYKVIKAFNPSGF